MMLFVGVNVKCSSFGFVRLEPLNRGEDNVSRTFIALAIIATAMTFARADSLSDMAQFAQSICGDIPEGSLTRTSIQGKVEANAGLLAKIISGDANVSGSKTEELYKGAATF